MAHFKAFLGSHQDLGPETAVLVLGTRPRPRSELKTLDTLLARHVLNCIFDIEASVRSRSKIDNNNLENTLRDEMSRTTRARLVRRWAKR